MSFLTEFRYLFRVLEQQRTIDIMKFADPSTVALQVGNRKIRAEGLAEIMSEIQKNQLLFVPWNIG